LIEPPSDPNREEHTMSTYAVETESLSKRYGEVHALRGIDLAVEPGTVLGVLGPNGAGKTTTVNILATLEAPTSGRAAVLGHDVVAQPAAVRASIGLTGQYAAVDEHLTARENLTLFGRLLGMTRAIARRRADELLARFALEGAADRAAGTYSGGMRRRLDLAASLVGRPSVVFLDEPTTGLDPRSRLQLWDVVRELVSDGTTVLLTTQYLEEADELADRIVVIDSGRVVAEGTSDDLKRRLGGQAISATLADVDRLGEAATVLDHIGIVGTVDVAARSIHATVGDAAAVAAAIRALDEAALVVDRLDVRSPSLDDVFLTLTGAGSDDLASRSPAAA
jgi:oleandomycin transport system ATP-binding protein